LKSSRSSGPSSILFGLGRSILWCTRVVVFSRLFSPELPAFQLGPGHCSAACRRSFHVRRYAPNTPTSWYPQLSFTYAFELLADRLCPRTEYREARNGDPDRGAVPGTSFPATLYYVRRRLKRENRSIFLRV
jgi:hypothetical protein